MNYFIIGCVNVQEIKFSFKDLLGKEAILSFNFVKIHDNFYNVKYTKFIN